MLDKTLIATLEESLQKTRDVQGRLIARLREAESEVEVLRLEINAIENSAAQTEKAINSLLVATRPGNGPIDFSRSLRIDDDLPIRSQGGDVIRIDSNEDDGPYHRRDNSVAYINQHRNIPARNGTNEPLSQRFSDRTITQACTLLLRESGGPLHVNDLYYLLVAGGMKFKGNNPTISVAVSLSRSPRFRKVDPGTFALDTRGALKAAS